MDRFIYKPSNWDLTMNQLNLLIKASRPAGWLVQSLAFLGGWRISGAGIDFLSVLQFLMMMFPLNLMLYGINDIYDYKSDMLNKRKGGAEGAKLKRKYHNQLRMKKSQKMSQNLQKNLFLS